MIVKGEIQSAQNSTGIYSSYDTRYRVRLPIFENAADGTPIIVEALLNYPLNYKGVYQAGDIVWVAFENNDFNHPVIIGSFYSPKAIQKEEESTPAALTPDSLEVASTAILPEDTTLGGDITTAYIRDNINALNKKAEEVDRQIDDLITENEDYTFLKLYRHTTTFTVDNVDYTVISINTDYQAYTLGKFFTSYDTSISYYMYKEETNTTLRSLTRKRIPIVDVTTTRLPGPISGWVTRYSLTYSESGSETTLVISSITDSVTELVNQA